MVDEWLVYCLKVQLLVAVFGLWSPVHSIQNHFKLLPNILNFKNIILVPTNPKVHPFLVTLEHCLTNCHSLQNGSLRHSDPPPTSVASDSGGNVRRQCCRENTPLPTLPQLFLTWPDPSAYAWVVDPPPGSQKVPAALQHPLLEGCRKTKPKGKSERQTT